ncbi:MAG: hypothetical protein GWO24_27065, partial [Akkermansiaceae bacterium]|nr:hypothetical protein [Akkermansiaceae bacterium]
MGGQHFGVGGVVVLSATPQILSLELAPTHFATSLETGGLAGTLTTTDQNANGTHTYALVTGEGD